LAISLSHGAEWKALINKYIGTIPVNGDTSRTAEHKTSGTPPPLTPVSRAMIKKVGAAAKDSKPSTLAPRRRPTLGATKSVVLQIIVTTLWWRNELSGCPWPDRQNGRP
jgi:hypothetical protein